MCSSDLETGPTIPGPLRHRRLAWWTQPDQTDGGAQPTPTHFLSRELGTAGFPADREPALTIAPGGGDLITFETDDEAYRQMHEHHDVAKVSATINPVTGPVHVTGAEPGDVLAVTVHDISFPTGRG